MKEKIKLISDLNKITDFLEIKSAVMVDHIEKNVDSSFHLLYKYVSYADVPTFGKRVSSKDPYEKDILNYLTVTEMKSIDEFDGSHTSKQSNIYMPTDFYKTLGIKQLKRRKGPQATQHQHILINDYADVFLVNDSLEHFSIVQTQKVLNKLKKLPKWNFKLYDFELDDGKYTPIQLSHAIHGIGTEKDELFHKIRRNVFKNDIIMFLIEILPNKSKKLFIIFDKNPKYYSIINETNKKWEKYLAIENKKNENLFNVSMPKLETEKSRTQQNKWRNLLAQEISNYTVEENEVFCIFTMIRANFDDLGTLFRASHIKRFENCTNEEAYDLNNGLLLCANADALFDKFLITISEDKKTIFSFLIENNYLLREQLQLTEKVFSLILNEERMEYLKWHREKFYELEEERKK